MSELTRRQRLAIYWKLTKLFGPLLKSINTPREQDVIDQINEYHRQLGHDR